MEHMADRHLCRQEKKGGIKKKSVKLEERPFGKKITTNPLLFLAALNCYILIMEALIMYFHGFMTNKSPHGMKSESHSQIEAKTLFHMYIILHLTERRGTVVMHPGTSFAIDLSLLPSSPASGVTQTPEMNHHLGCTQLSCHSTNWSAGTGVPSPKPPVGAAQLPAGRHTLSQAGTLQIQPSRHQAATSLSRIFTALIILIQLGPNLGGEIPRWQHCTLRFLGWAALVNHSKPF